MKRRVSFLFCFSLLCLSSHVRAQQTIVAPSRSVDWQNAGVVGGIPNRTTICSTLSPGATAAQINSAIDNCPSGQVVFLNAGTYNLSGQVTIDKDNVTLRGAGAHQTVLNMSSAAAGGCHIGDSSAVRMCQGSSNIGIDSPDHTATWSTGYAKGSTVITLNCGAACSGLTVGTTLWLDQLDEPDGYPAVGDITTDSWNGGDSYVRSGRGVTEGHIVTNYSGSNITISPGVMMPDIRSSQSPGAWWGNATSVLVGAGIEHLTIDSTASGTNAFYAINCTNCYQRGVRTLYRNTVSGGQFRVSAYIQTVNMSVVDNYYYGPLASGLVNVYGITVFVVSGFLFQNNIVHASVNPFVIDSAIYGSVLAYNVFDNVGVNASFSQSSFIMHGYASMNLWEGNNLRNISGDNIQTSHLFNTFFRNHFDGTLRNPSGTETQAAVALYARSRFFNVVGNVAGASNWNSYQTSMSHCGGCIYELGWRGTSSIAAPITGDDTNVLRTIMRWGNWDGVTSTNDNGSNDATGTRFVASEVPSGIANYSNPQPASQALPASFYLTAKPSWFGSVAWPPIGPDVSNSNITSNTGGHANKIPARLCFEAAANDPAYSSSSPRIKLFGASLCYSQSSSPPPNPPSNLRILP